MPHRSTPGATRAPWPRLALALAAALACALVSTRAGAQRPVRDAVAPDASRIVAFDTTAIPPYVPREFRGVWISPADGADWPSRPGLGASRQQAELLALLDRAQAIGLNAVIFHVRTSGDALYPTSLAPWSARITGTQGESPEWDPLAFAVREAHARGMQLHAWFNPFRASLDGGIAAAPTHVTRAHPGWVVRYGSQLWIDPGLPEARDAVLDAVVEVVQRYDVDGVHLDDFFYPYQETRTVSRRVGKGRRRHTVTSTELIDFPDARSWKRHGAGWTDRGDWRRRNIDAFVEALAARVHEAKPWVLVGISPFGLWRPGAPAGITGLDAYGEIYADSRKWLREGWVDYLAPQLYWPLEGAQDRFRALDDWWRAQNPLGRHLWPGLYTAGATGRGGWDASEIPRQIATLREGRRGSAESDGHVHFRIASLGGRDPLAAALGERLGREQYRGPALVPESPWLAGVAPGAPVAQLADVGGGTLLLLGVRDSVPLAWWLVQARLAPGQWTTRVVPASTRQLALDELSPAADLVVVRGIARTGRTGARATVALPRPPRAPMGN